MFIDYTITLKIASRAKIYLEFGSEAISTSQNQEN